MKKRCYGFLNGIVSITLLLLTGCGTQIHEASSPTTPKSTASQSTPRKGKSIQEPINRIPYTEAQLAAMTPQQLAKYRDQHGVPLPFASRNIVRHTTKSPLLISNPDSSSMFGVPKFFADGIEYPSNLFYVWDQWAGSIQNHTFTLEIDKERAGNTFIVGVMYGKRSHVIVLHKPVWITNFTGSYVVFATPNPAQGHPYYAINLTNGKVLSNGNIPESVVYQMSGQDMGGYGSEIIGLPRVYTTSGLLRTDSNS